MLIGGSKHAIDAKGRIFFPARFKEELWDDIIACRGLDKNLMLFNRQEWILFTDRIKRQPFSTALKLQRHFMSEAAECSVDGQGRLLLPQLLREFAGLKKDVHVTGAQNHAEIWDVEEWQRAQLTNDEVREIVDNADF